MTASDVRAKHWTRAQYYELAERGSFNGQRVELIDGEIIEMSPQKHRHATAIVLVQETLHRLFGGDFTLRVQLPLALAEDSEPEPDLALVRGRPRDYADHPTTAMIVVEVAETTLDFDVGDKASLYARSGIPEYWVLNLVDRTLIVHREPQADAGAPRGGRYAGVTVLAATDHVRPLAAPQATIPVADLLP